MILRILRNWKTNILYPEIIIPGNYDKIVQFYQKKGEIKYELLVMIYDLLVCGGMILILSYLFYLWNLLSQPLSSTAPLPTSLLRWGKECMKSIDWFYPYVATRALFSGIRF